MSDLLCWRIEAAFAGSWRDILVGNTDSIEWTDLTPAVRMVDGVDATRGRTSEDGNVTAGSLRFRLNNDDGQFTPGRPDLLSDWIAATFDSVDDYVAAYPEFLLSPDRVALHGRPIRLVYDPGTDVVLWTGVVESVESGWSSGIRGFATVRAVDAAAYAGRVTMRALPVAGLTAVEPYVRWVYPLDERDAPCLDLVGPDAAGMSAAPLLAHSIGTPGVIGAELTFEGVAGVHPGRGRVDGARVHRGFRYVGLVPGHKATAAVRPAGSATGRVRFGGVAVGVAGPGGAGAHRGRRTRIWYVVADHPGHVHEPAPGCHP